MGIGRIVNPGWAPRQLSRGSARKHYTRHALIGGIMSIFNAAGRIVWGALSDKIGHVTTMILMFLILILAMFGFSAIALGPNSWIVVTAVVSIIGFCLGGNFALFPSATAD